MVVERGLDRRLECACARVGDNDAGAVPARILLGDGDCPLGSLGIIECENDCAIHCNTSVWFSPWSRAGLWAASGRVPNSCAGFPYGGSWRPPMAVLPDGASLEPLPSSAEVRDERPAAASRRDCRRRGGGA